MIFKKNKKDEVQQKGDKIQVMAELWLPRSPSNLKTSGVFFRDKGTKSAPNNSGMPNSFPPLKMPKLKKHKFLIKIELIKNYRK